MSVTQPPVVIIGMHRSGTSLLTRVLQQHGFFMGAGATRNEEARFTNAINAWLFREASATWDRPEGMDDLLADKDLVPWLVDYLDGITRGPAALRFLGPRGLARTGLSSALRHGMHALTGPWGWKDPRNTWTLPFWQEAFPDLRVLHIMRHGVDVAESLRVRRDAVFRARTRRYQRRRRWSVNQPLAPRRRGFGPQVRVAELDRGLALWAAYVERAQAHADALAAEGRALTLRYEDLLRDPRPHLRQAFAFCGVTPEEGTLERTAASVRPERAEAWRTETRLRTVAARNANTLMRFGCDAHPE